MPPLQKTGSRHDPDKLSALINAISTGFVLLNKALEIEILNKKAAEQFAKFLDNSPQPGDNIYNFLPQNGRAIIQNHFTNALEGKSAEFNLEYNTLKEISIHITIQPAFSDEGAIIGICLTIDDFTEKKNWNSLAKRNAEIFENAYIHSSIAVGLVTPDGSWLNVNPAFTKLVGYSKKELLKTKVQDITHPDDIEDDLKSLKQLLNREIENYQKEKRYVHKNGEIIYVILSVSLVWDIYNKPDFFIGQVIDITPTKLLIHELEEKNVTLEKISSALKTQNNQLQDLQHMIGHDVRGPVNNIAELIQLLEQNNESNFSTLLPMIKKSCALANHVITGLLDLAQLNLEGKVPFTECYLKLMIDEIYTSLKSRAKGVVIKYDLEIPMVLYPMRYLQSALYNLLSNAVKYRSKTDDCIIEISSRRNNDKTVIQIKDNGIGFDSRRNKDSLFKPGKVFHTGGYDSLGIGLFITKSQIEKFGGSITVESEINKGTVFTIVI